MKQCACLCGLYLIVCGLSAQPVTDWRALFQKRTIAEISSIPDTPAPAGLSNFLVVLSAQTELPATAGFENLRQLDKHSFIIRTTAGWLTAHHSAFTVAVPANDNWKLSPALLNPAGAINIYNLSVSGIQDFIHALHAYRDSVSVEYVYRELNIVRVRTSSSFLRERLLPRGDVLFAASGDRMAKEESIQNPFDNTVNKINLAHVRYPNVNGAGLLVSIKENHFDTTDIDLKGRIVNAPGSADLITAHASSMATLIAGGGNTSFAGQGGAWGASVSSTGFGVLLPDTGLYQPFHIAVQNHSYGVGLENYYGSDAAAYDASMIANPSLLHVFSAGNSGDQAPVDGIYSGVSGWANLTGSFKMAKNVLTVGSENSVGFVPLLSSKGPAYDGRVKPDLVAFGDNGSSDASAIVSGIVLLVQHAFATGHNGSLPPSALVKAVLLNSADDVGAPGIDFASGYGSANAFRAIQTISNGNFFSGVATKGQETQFTLQVPDQVRNLKLTLCWNDVPAAPNAFISLLNDLDLLVTNNGSGQTWLPWVLNSSANADSLKMPARRGRDSLNVSEQISLSNPVAGNYTIRVKGDHLKSDTQPFHIAFQWDSINHFQWTFPVAGDPVKAGTWNILHWENSFPDSVAILEYTTDQGNNWILIDSMVNLRTGLYQWYAPDIFSTVMFRMRFGTSLFNTAATSLSRQLTLSVGFNCGDSILLYWPRIAAAVQYQLYALSGNYLAPQVKLTDTAVVLSGIDRGTSYFSVAPLLAGGVAGMKAVSVNYRNQKYGCYVNDLLATLQSPGVARITLTMGTLFNTASINIEKRTFSGWRLLKTIVPTSALVYTIQDSSVTTGVNTYCARIGLQNGSQAFGKQANLYQSGKEDYLIFPNPVQPGQPLNVLSRTVADRMAIVYDLAGKKVASYVLKNIFESIPLTGVARGNYVLVVQENDKQVFMGRFLVQ